MRMCHGGLVGLLLVAVAARPSVADPVDWIPADAFVVVTGDPARFERGRGASAARGGFNGEQLLSLASQLRLLPEEARVWADIVGTLGLLTDSPYAFALLDVTSKPLPGGSYRLAQMQAAMVFETHGRNEPIAERIRTFLAGYTNAQLSILTSEELSIGTRYRLTDSRLPNWSVIEWFIGKQYFVVAFGQGALDRILAVKDASSSIGAAEWYERAQVRAAGADAFFTCYLAASRLRDRLGEVVQGRPAQVLAAIGAGDVSQLLLTIGWSGRAVVTLLVVALPDQDVRIPISGRLAAADEARVIPDDADGYAAFALPLAAWIRRGGDAYLATQHPNTQEVLREGWHRFEVTYGFDVERDLLNHLGSRFIVHDAPRHPLGIPLLWTYLIEIDGDRASVQRAIDGMMRAWRCGLGQEGDQPTTRSLGPAIRQTEDGIWFVQLGLAGPAVAVHDRWIVVSFSPAAVRQVLADLAVRSW